MREGATPLWGGPGRAERRRPQDVLSHAARPASLRPSLPPEPDADSSPSAPSAGLAPPRPPPPAGAPSASPPPPPRSLPEAVAPAGGWERAGDLRAPVGASPLHPPDSHLSCSEKSFAALAGELLLAGGPRTTFPPGRLLHGHLSRNRKLWFICYPQSLIDPYFFFPRRKKGHRAWLLGVLVFKSLGHPHSWTALELVIAAKF